MNVKPLHVPLQQFSGDGLIVGICGTELEGSAAELDAALDGAVQRLIEAGEVQGKSGEVTMLLGHAAVAVDAIALAGLGPREELEPRGVFQAASAASLALAAKQRSKVAVSLGLESAELIEAAVCGVISASHGCDLHRSKKKTFPFDELLCAGVTAETSEQLETLGQAICLTRRLVNEPAGYLDPAAFAAEAERVAAAAGMQAEIWDRDRLETENCGALLAVARGSAKPPRLVILRHQGGDQAAPWLALVGKGVTFDSGGLSLKPSDSMKSMKCDMAGAATVLGAMQAIAQSGLPVNVMGLCGLVENMVSGDAYKLGDVLTARNGKTIEVLNTDAEGRLVLADTLDVAVEQGAAKIIDLATLTGACLVALGTETAGLMTNDQAWCDRVAAAAETCGERVWQLPMFPEYGDQIRSAIADIKNIGEGRWAGAITAAKFLEEFVGDVPWTHIDIAGPAFLESAKPWQTAGGTGALLRTLVRLAAQPL